MQKDILRDNHDSRSLNIMGKYIFKLLNIQGLSGGDIS